MKNILRILLVNILVMNAASMFANCWVCDTDDSKYCITEYGSHEEAKMAAQNRCPGSIHYEEQSETMGNGSGY